MELKLRMNMKILIASGAGGGTAKGRIGKHIHLKDFGEASITADQCEVALVASIAKHSVHVGSDKQ